VDVIEQRQQRLLNEVVLGLVQVELCRLGLRRKVEPGFVLDQVEVRHRAVGLHVLGEVGVQLQLFALEEMFELSVLKQLVNFAVSDDDRKEALG
jgi:hypothetical protein